MINDNSFARHTRLSWSDFCWFFSIVVSGYVLTVSSFQIHWTVVPDMGRTLLSLLSPQLCKCRSLSLDPTSAPCYSFFPCTMSLFLDLINFDTFFNVCLNSFVLTPSWHLPRCCRRSFLTRLQIPWRNDTCAVSVLLETWLHVLVFCNNNKTLIDYLLRIRHLR